MHKFYVLNRCQEYYYGNRCSSLRCQNLQKRTNGWKICQKERILTGNYIGSFGSYLGSVLFVLLTTGRDFLNQFSIKKYADGARRLFLRFAFQMSTI